MYEWGISDNGKDFIERDIYLESHICTPEELGLKGDTTNFMPT